MSNQVNIFLLLFGGLQGALLLLLLFKKKFHQPGHLFLLSYLLVMIAQVLFKVMSKVWLMENLQPYYLLSSRLPLLYGPLVYLFARRVCCKPIRPVQEALHFLPFIATALLIFLAPHYLGKPPLAVLFYGDGSLVIQLLSVVAYHCVALVQCKEYSSIIDSGVSDAALIRLRWLRQFILLSALLCISIAVTIHLMYWYYPGLQYIRWGFLALSIFIYWISYSAISKPQLFVADDNHFPRETQVPVVPFVPGLAVHKRPEKYANTGLKEAEASRILERLQQVVQEQRIFLDPGITIDGLANLADTNRHFLSQVLNERLGQSFHEYINQHRVNEAKRLLLDPTYSNHKIASIAYDAGFNSLSAFNEVFKKITGSTPSGFRKQEQLRPNWQRG